MKRKLYYTIDKEVDEIDQALFDATGNKSIVVYEIKDNRPQVFFEIDSTLEANSEEEIKDWLDDNGYGDEDFDLIHL